MDLLFLPGLSDALQTSVLSRVFVIMSPISSAMLLM